jgi:hypothetical protein
LSAHIDPQRYRHSVPTLRLRPSQRLLAWLVTGPIGHLLAGLLDAAVLLARLAWARLLGRRL